VSNKSQQVPTRRKQLIVLLVVAAWVSLQFLDVEFQPSLSSDIEKMAVQALYAFVRSVPVILFGGVLFWWFGRKERDGKEN
jgi:ABC-type phosphate/phosphonate transport system permease subunit